MNDNSVKLPVVNPLLIVISGPSGVGKDAALNRMKLRNLAIHYVVTATTRSMRPGETDGIDYHFIDQSTFQEKLRLGEFIEWAHVYGNYYGVPMSEIKGSLAAGKDVVVKVDIQGAATIKKIAPDAVFIFLVPPTLDELTNRLKKRHGTLGSDLNNRIAKARDEINELPLFDYVLVTHNNEIEATVDEIIAIFTAEKLRVQPRNILL